MALILLVDDSQFSRSLIMKILGRGAHTTLEAENGIGGLKILQDHTPDCIIADVLMPEMDGPKFLMALRNLHIDIPVIILTADIQEKTREICLELGAAEVLHKPPREADLLAAIDKAINKEKQA